MGGQRHLVLPKQRLVFSGSHLSPPALKSSTAKSAQSIRSENTFITRKGTPDTLTEVIFLSRVFLYKKSKISKRTKRTEPFTIYAKRMEAATNEIMFSALHKIGQHKTSLPTVRELIFFSPPLDEYLSV